MVSSAKILKHNFSSDHEASSSGRKIGECISHECDVNKHIES